MDNGTEYYRRFLDGDESGLTDIVREYKDGLIFYINSIVCDIHAAEDIAEDTFFRLLVKKPKDSALASFKTWLYTIGRNTAFNYLKKQKKVIPSDGIAEVCADEEELETSFLREERKIAVHRVLGKLKPEHRQALWLTYFEGFSGKETARIMGKTDHAVETLLYRARLSFRHELEKEGYTDEKL